MSVKIFCISRLATHGDIELKQITRWIAIFGIASQKKGTRHDNELQTLCMSVDKSAVVATVVSSYTQDSQHDMYNLLTHYIAKSRLCCLLKILWQFQAIQIEEFMCCILSKQANDFSTILHHLERASWSWSMSSLQRFIVSIHKFARHQNHVLNSWGRHWESVAKNLAWMSAEVWACKCLAILHWSFDLTMPLELCHPV